MSYVLEVKEASDGELLLNLPEEIHNELGWIDGDLIEWNVKGPGLVLNRLNQKICQTLFNACVCDA